MNIPKPRVSVLMPTFEQSHFIRRALDSLLAQSMSDWAFFRTEIEHSGRSPAPSRSAA